MDMQLSFVSSKSIPYMQTFSKSSRRHSYPFDIRGIQTQLRISFFDLETSGLNCYKNEILQIAAKCGSPGGRPFNAYCKPTKQISEEIARVKLD